MPDTVPQIIEQQLEIIHRQQDTIDELTRLLRLALSSRPPAQEDKDKEIEERIIVPESQRSIGRIPWEIRKVRLEEQHRASKIKETVQLHEGSDEWSDNGISSSE